MALDYDRLCRLMMMTTSDNLPEAHLALKKANDMLKKANTTWARILTPQAAPAQPARNNSGHGYDDKSGTHIFSKGFNPEAIFRGMVREFGKGLAEGINPLPKPKRRKK